MFRLSSAVFSLRCLQSHSTPASEIECLHRLSSWRVELTWEGGGGGVKGRERGKAAQDAPIAITHL